MRRVHRQPEPPELTAFRHWSPNATWDQLKDHLGGVGLDDFRAALTSDQGGLCVYCEVKLPTSRGGGAIVEHFHPRAAAHNNCVADGPRQDWATLWTNVFAACDGGSGSGDEHCDRPKGEQDLCAEILRPLQMAAVPHLTVLPATGRIEVGENCPADSRQRAEAALDRLRLDCDRLRSLRTEWLGTVLDGIFERAIAFEAQGVPQNEATARAQEEESHALLTNALDLPPFVTALRSVLGPELDRRLDDLGVPH